MQCFGLNVVEIAYSDMLLLSSSHQILLMPMSSRIRRVTSPVKRVPILDSTYVPNLDQFVSDDMGRISKPFAQVHSEFQEVGGVVIDLRSGLPCPVGLGSGLPCPVGLVLQKSYPAARCVHHVKDKNL